MEIGEYIEGRIWDVEKWEYKGDLVWGIIIDQYTEKSCDFYSVQIPPRGLVFAVKKTDVLRILDKNGGNKPNPKN